MSKICFPADFLWGTATSAYQVEGAASEDGRGESIWDRFSHTPGKTFNGDTGDIACDHYHRYKRDVGIMNDLGLKAYRFSISWPRIFPNGKGAINQKGVDFYNRLVDELLSKGIEPMVTLYHWDLPQALQDGGGWDNRDTIGCFADYGYRMFNILGDRVKLWTTHNEILSSAFLGNATGEYAPGFADIALAVRVSHHMLVSHATTVNAFRQSDCRKGKIGIVQYSSDIYPATSSPEDAETARLVDGICNRWFWDPVMKGSYPQDILDFFERNYRLRAIRPGDETLFKENPVDFLGVNYYTRFIVKKSSDPHKMGYDTVVPEGSDVTDIGWEIYPRGLYNVLMRIHKDYKSPLVYVTENGAAYDDPPASGKIIRDGKRIDYLKRHLAEIRKAMDGGANVKGYFLWSLMDNFEWSHGFSQRFGIVHVDFKTLARSFRQSSLWYRDIIAENGFNI